MEKLLAFVLSLVGWSAANSVSVISYHELTVKLVAGQVILVDVREPHEFAAGHIPGAFNMPLSRFDPTLLPKAEGRSTVVMCRSGNRSGQAQSLAAKAGRTDVLNYGGSMLEWAAKGGPVVKGASPG